MSVNEEMQLGKVIREIASSVNSQDSSFRGVRSDNFSYEFEAKDKKRFVSVPMVIAKKLYSVFTSMMLGLHFNQAYVAIIKIAKIYEAVKVLSFRLDDVQLSLIDNDIWIIFSILYKNMYDYLISIYQSPSDPIVGRPNSILKNDFIPADFSIGNFQVDNIAGFDLFSTHSKVGKPELLDFGNDDSGVVGQLMRFFAFHGMNRSYNIPLEPQSVYFDEKGHPRIGFFDPENPRNNNTREGIPNLGFYIGKLEDSDLHQHWLIPEEYNYMDHLNAKDFLSPLIETDLLDLESHFVITFNTYEDPHGYLKLTKTAPFYKDDNLKNDVNNLLAGLFSKAIDHFESVL